MATRKDFIAKQLSHEEIRKSINVDKLYYQTIEDLKKAAQLGNPKIKNFCHACMGGPYPAGKITEKVLRRVEQQRTPCESPENEDQLTLL